MNNVSSLSPALPPANGGSTDGSGTPACRISPGAPLLSGARLLTPEDFGLVALVSGVLIVLNSPDNLPAADVFVQRRESAKKGPRRGVYPSNRAQASGCGPALRGTVPDRSHIRLCGRANPASPGLVGFTRTRDYRRKRFCRAERLSTFLAGLSSLML